MIIATAGHVDHGKTRLVEALTGIDTDTLAEEKKRGLTVDIGFAYLPAEGQPSIGFIDVPGHERFIKNALCGLIAADFVLLVVAADDGPMPQTIEHLSIIDLLNVRQGIIVISKTDRVSADQIDAVAFQVRRLTKNTTLRSWPTFQVSSVSNDGIDALKTFLVQAGLTCVRSESLNHRNFRMAIDRVFEKKGAGLIVTGTIFDGLVNIDDIVTITDSGMKLRVRSLRIQNSESDQGKRGQRCAINLAGIDLRKDLIKRGSWVTSPGTVSPVNRFDAEIRILNQSQRPLEHWTPIHIHLAASESTARIAVLGSKAINPGETGLVQVVSDNALGAVFGDHFIIRDQSARVTLGGGRVIDIFPPRRGRARSERIEFLRQSNQTNARSALEALLNSSTNGVNLEQFAKNRNLTSRPESVMVTLIDRVGFSQAMVQTHYDNILQALTRCHEISPDSGGFSEIELQQNLNERIPSHLLKGLLTQLQKLSLIENNVGGYSLTSHQIRLSSEHEQTWKILSKLLCNAGSRGVTVTEFSAHIKLPSKPIKDFLFRAERLGLLVKLSQNLFILPSCLQQLKELLDQITKHNCNYVFTLTEFRDASAIGRNRCIEILECFDARGITRRIEQGRQLLPNAYNALENLLNHVK